MPRVLDRTYEEFPVGLQLWDERPAEYEGRCLDCGFAIEVGQAASEVKLFPDDPGCRTWSQSIDLMLCKECRERWG